MNPCMYIMVDKSLGMSTGKTAAQAAHAAVEAYIGTPESNLKRVWHRGGHYTKIILEADGWQQLQDALTYIEKRGFMCFPIIDEGRTEVKPYTATCFGVQIVDKDNAHVAATFSGFKLYRDVEPWLPPENGLTTVKPSYVKHVRRFLRRK
jgi:peptidyl-tRNA hydrolase